MSYSTWIENVRQLAGTKFWYLRQIYSFDCAFAAGFTPRSAWQEALTAAGA